MKPSDVRMMLDHDGSYLFTLSLPDGRTISERLSARGAQVALAQGLFQEVAREIRSDLLIDASNLLDPLGSIDLSPLQHTSPFADFAQDLIFGTALAVAITAWILKWALLEGDSPPFHHYTE